MFNSPEGVKSPAFARVVFKVLGVDPSAIDSEVNKQPALQIVSSSVLVPPKTSEPQAELHCRCSGAGLEQFEHGVGVVVGVMVAVGLAGVGVTSGVGVSLGETVGVSLCGGVPVVEAVGVVLTDGVPVVEADGETLADAVGEVFGVGVIVSVAVALGLGVRVRVGLGVKVAIGVDEGVLVGLMVGEDGKQLSVVNGPQNSKDIPTSAWGGPPESTSNVFLPVTKRLFGIVSD